MRRALLLLILLLFALPAEARTYLDYQEILVDLELSGSVRINPTGPQAEADQVSATLLWVPIESFRQEVSQLESMPPAERGTDRLTYTWERPPIGELDYRLNARIESKLGFKPVRHRIAFPIEDLDASLEEYTLAAQIIDITPEIEALAFELSEGEDDLFQVVYNLADWATTNIEYDLSTTTSDASQKSSWVLENRRGVCDELTSLFISLNRALGIPARFISGISYTNLEEFEQPWGPHGWAEVYFPGEGWVPFDVTYGQYGYVDATHIKLDQGVDAGENAVEYVSFGREIEIEPGKLDIKTIPLRNGSLITPFIQLKATLFEDSVGYGSYDLITVSLTNTRDYYVSTAIHLSRTQHIEAEGGYKRNVLLGPYEERTIYWLIKVSDDLKRGFLYTFPLTIDSPLSNPAQLRLRGSEEGQVYGRRVFTDTITTVEEAKELPYSQFADFSCAAHKERVYVNESIPITCELKNRGDRDLLYLRVCLADDCHRGSLAAGQAQTYRFNGSFAEAGLKTVAIRAYNMDISKSRLVRARVLDEVRIAIEDVEHPQSLAYDEEGSISFVLRRLSSAQPRNLRVSVEHPNIQHEWELEELPQSKKFTLHVPGSALSLKGSEFAITITYEDALGASQREQVVVPVAPKDPSVWEKVKLWLNGLLARL